MPQHLIAGRQGALTIPPVTMDFPRHRHEQQDLARELTRTWAQNTSVLSSRLVAQFLDELHYTELIAGYYVRAPLPALVAINNFSLWFFVWDDWHDRYITHRKIDAWNRQRDALHLALDDPYRHLGHADPLVSSFADSMIRLFECGLSRAWADRFATHCHSTIDAYDQEFTNRTCGTIPTVEAYLDLRRHTFSVWVWVDLLELAAECELPGEVYHSASYQAAALASQEFSAWFNDLHSMPKELAAGDFHNYGIVLAHQEGIPVQEAAGYVARQIERRLSDYKAHERLIPQTLDAVNADPALREGVERCLFNMRNWISSVYWFHHESSRYRMDTWDDPAIPPYVDAAASR